MAESDDRSKIEREFAIYRDDVVRTRGNSLIGVVEGVGGHSDSEEDEEEFAQLPKGSARVSWFKKTDNPATVLVDTLEVVDRALVHHDVIARRSAPLGQSGYVTAVHVKCDVRFLATGEVMEGVEAGLLQQVMPLKQGTYVVHKQWLGQVEDAFEHVTVRMVDGSVCRIANADPEVLVPLDDEGFNEDTPYFYPGLRVKTNQGLLMRSNWLKGGPKSGIKEGLVLSVEPGRTHLRWVAANQMQSEDAVEPKQEVDGRKLQILDAFAHTWWQLGDMAILDTDRLLDIGQGLIQNANTGPLWGMVNPLLQSSSPSPHQAETGALQDTAAAGTFTGCTAAASKGMGSSDGNDAARAGSAAGNSQAARRRSVRSVRGYHGRLTFKDKSTAAPRKGDFRDDIAKCVEIISTSTRVDVIWQDGCVEAGVPSIQLVPVKHMGAHDFFPEEYVLDKIDDEPVDLSMPHINMHFIQNLIPDLKAESDAVDMAEVEQIAKPESDALTEHTARANPHTDVLHVPQLAASAIDVPTDTALDMPQVQPKDHGLLQENERLRAGAPREPGMQGGIEGGIEMMKAHDLGLNLPSHLLQTLHLARHKLHEQVVKHLSAGDVAQLDALVASGNLSETFRFVTSHPQSYSFLQGLMRSPEWQHLLRDGAVQQISQELLSQQGLVQGSQRRHRFGIIKEIDCSERICKVKWLGICNFDGSREVVGEEAAQESAATLGTPAEIVLGTVEQSCYEVVEHPAYNYCIGDVVVRLHKKHVAWHASFMREAFEEEEEEEEEHLSDKSGSDDEWETESEYSDEAEETRTNRESVHESEEESEGREDDSEKECEGTEGRNDKASDENSEAILQKSGTEESNLFGAPGDATKQKVEAQQKKKRKEEGRWVGQIMAMRDGRLQVKWLTGSDTWVWPCQVFVVSEHDQHWHDEDNHDDDGSDWETVASDEHHDLPNADALDANHVIAQVERLNALARSSHAGMHYPEDEDSEGEGMSDEDEDEGSEKNEEEQESKNKEDTEASEKKRSRHHPQHAARPLPDHAARASTANTASKDAFALETLTTRLYGVSHAGASIKHVWSAVGSAVGSRMAAWFPSAPSTPSHHHPVPTLSPSSPHPNGVACDATPEPAAVFQVEAAPDNEAGAGGMVHVPARPRPATHAPSQPSQPSETSEVSQYVPPRASATSATAATAAPSEGHVNEEEDEEGEGEGQEEEDGAESAFQVVPTLAGHRFQGAAGATLPPRHFITHVRKEWKLLRSSLPTGIHIRVSEERMDLMRAVIIGPAKTPYADGFFVFDIFLPQEYPNVAPEVLFHSYGDRLNPNLYDNGKVCLSLLGTWAGNGVETWNPNSSTVLQVLVSIQGLVLVPEPYYNEAGYQKQIGTMEGNHNSKQYNESALLLVLKHMTFSVTHPMPPFEALIRDHFRRRGGAIIRRCQRILDDAGAAAGGIGGGAAGGIGGGAAGVATAPPPPMPPSTMPPSTKPPSTAPAPTPTAASAPPPSAVGAPAAAGAGCVAALVQLVPQQGAANVGNMQECATNVGVQAMEELEDCDEHHLSSTALGWADRSVPESASKGFVRSLQKILPRLKATFPAPKTTPPS